MRTKDQVPESVHHRLKMNDDEIRLRAPSVFATAPHEGVSSRYSFVPTTDLVAAMRDAGWKVVSAKEQCVRGSKAGFQKHLLMFQHRDVVPVRGEFMPEVALTNSHDRTTTSQLGFALWRFTCSNGLMISESEVKTGSVRHTGDAPAEMVRASVAMFAQLPAVCGRVEQFRARELSAAEQTEFATQALVMRFGSMDESPVTAERVLEARRREDSGSNLWLVLNRVQENFMRGGLKDRQRRNADGDRYAATRAITSLNVGLTLNRGLWELASSFAA